MAYTSDVFLSYAHLGEVPAWAHDFFLPMFRSRLSQALGRPAEIFVDRDGIGTGSA